MFALIKVNHYDNEIEEVTCYGKFESFRDADEYLSNGIKERETSIKERQDYISNYVKSVSVPKTVDEYNARFNVKISRHNTEDDIIRLFPHNLFYNRLTIVDPNYNPPLVKPFDNYNVYIVEIK